MKRLLLALCLFAAVHAAAQNPACFDVPFTVEFGRYYVVTVETAAGPRRFCFDTGASSTIISERLCGELGLVPEKGTALNDFEGHSQTVPRVRVPYLKMGQAEFRNRQVYVLPDSSYTFRCLRFDGFVGSDLLQEYAVRMPNADSTITFARDVRLLGKLDRRNSMRMHIVGTRPMVAPRLSDGKRNYKVYMLFDTGSSGLFHCRYDECQALIDNGIAHSVRRTEGYAGMGWTNRAVEKEVIRGVVPVFELAGQPLAGMPFKVTHGTTSKLGWGIFRWGTVILDYPGRRFYLLPHTEQPDAPDASVENVAVAIDDGGRLVVGQVWDESLADIIAPGDRIVCVGTQDVEHVDICAFMRGEIRADKPQLTVERKDGTRVTVPVKKL